MKFSPLINVKMPTIVGILTFMRGKNSILGISEPKNSRISWYLSTYEHLKFHAQLNWARKKFYNLGPWICTVPQTVLPHYLELYHTVTLFIPSLPEITNFTQNISLHKIFHSQQGLYWWGWYKIVTVKILKIGTPEIITVIVLQLEKLDFTV